MTKQEKNEFFLEMTKTMAEIYENKNSNYGDSFSKLVKQYGLVAGVIPLTNKLNRISTLVENSMKTGNFNNYYESIEDSLIDLANYAIMTLIELEDLKRNNESKRVEE